MFASKTIHAFKIQKVDNYIVLEAQEYPWTRCQVVHTTPENREQVLAELEKRYAPIAEHDTDKSFYVFQIGGGDYDGKHPERFVEVNQNNYEQVCEAIEDTVAQAAVWYKVNIIDNLNKF